jgi:hypothetical protein
LARHLHQRTKPIGAVGLAHVGRLERLPARVRLRDHPRFGIADDGQKRWL